MLVTSWRAPFSQVPVQPGHNLERVARDGHQDVLVRRMLGASGIGVWNPDRGNAEQIGEEVVTDRTAGLRNDGERRVG